MALDRDAVPDHLIVYEAVRDARRTDAHAAMTALVDKAFLDKAFLDTETVQGRSPESIKTNASDAL